MKNNTVRSSASLRGVAGVASALLLAAGALAVLPMSGCNTVEGAGKDISAAGRGISDGAEATSDAIDDAFDDN